MDHMDPDQSQNVNESITKKPLNLDKKTELANQIKTIQIKLASAFSLTLLSISNYVILICLNRVRCHVISLIFLVNGMFLLHLLMHRYGREDFGSPRAAGDWN